MTRRKTKSSIALIEAWRVFLASPNEATRDAFAQAAKAYRDARRSANFSPTFAALLDCLPTAQKPEGQS
jgi:hypothetical protein